MGQYYRAYIGDKNGNPVKDGLLSSNDFSKLMEFSWLGNALVDEVAQLLYKDSQRVVFGGDYSDEDDDYAFPLLSDEIRRPNYENIWSEDTNVKKVCSKASIKEYKKKFGEDIFKDYVIHDESFTLEGTFLVNHDTKEYLSLDDYKKRATKKYAGNWVKSVHPLSLLTAV